MKTSKQQWKPHPLVIHMDIQFKVMPRTADKKWILGTPCNAHVSLPQHPMTLSAVAHSLGIRAAHSMNTALHPTEWFIFSILRRESKSFVSSIGGAIDRGFLWHRSTCHIEWICMATEVQIRRFFCIFLYELNLMTCFYIWRAEGLPYQIDYRRFP